MTSRMKRSQGQPAPAQSEIMARLAAAAAGNSQAITLLDSLELAPTSMTIKRDLTESEWFQLMETLENIKRRHQWYLGDGLRYGVTRKYGETTEQLQRIMAITGKSRTSLQDYFKTARLFEINERSLICPFEVHKVIAVAFSEETPEHAYQRKRWLEIAEQQNMSRSEIYEAIFPSETPDLPPLLDPENRQRFFNLWSLAKRGQYIKISDDDITLMHRWLDKLSGHKRDAHQSEPKPRKKRAEKKKRARKNLI